MPILIDGNNLLHALPPGERSRDSVRRLILDQTRRERITVTVVFDGPPPEGASDRENLGAITIVYSGATTADDVIARRIPRGPAARSWTVVTNDRELAQRVTMHGATVRGVKAWLSRKGRPQGRTRVRTEAPLSKAEVEDWERYFEGKD